MDSRPLELILRRRLLAVLGAALALVGGATFLVVAIALDRIDEDVARARATSTLRMLRDELAEGDSIELAAREVIVSTEADHARILVRRGGAIRWPANGDAEPEELRALKPDTCAFVMDPSGVRWCACTLADPGDALSVVAAVPTTAHVRALHAIAWGTLVAVIAAIFVAFAAVRTTLRAPMRALHALALWTDGVSGTERPTAPLSSGRLGAELGVLATAFERLVSRLFDALERERATSSHIAHELRTPLTALRADLEALDGGDVRVQRMRQDVEQLGRAIDGVLALARPATSAPSLVNLADLAREIAPGEVTIEAPDEALVEGDPHLLELALRNLLDNAAKHAGGAHLVIVRRAGDDAEIAVRDRGAGIAPEARARMFDRFWSGAPDSGGLGLGLSLVRAVAERHGGMAFGRDNPDGPGAEIGFRVRPIIAWHAEPST